VIFVALIVPGVWPAGQTNLLAMWNPQRLLGQMSCPRCRMPL